MNNPVSFELAKLLKEKGFNEPTIDQYYLSNGIYKLKEIKEGVFSNSELEKDGENYGGSNPNFWISAPTIADVVMWLYEKYHTFISVVNEPNVHRFKWIITNLALVGYKRYIHSDKLKEMNEEETEYLYQHYFNSPIEAYEAGIKYCLEKVI
jgi:hypothetical protein